MDVVEVVVGRGGSRGRGRGRNYNNNNNYEKGENSTREYRALSNKIEEKANYVEEKTDGKKTLLLARKETDGGQAKSWYLDSGASNHMCGRKDMFVELYESVSENVSFGDDSTIAVKGRGNILIRLKDGRHQFISNVYYVPTMKSNILSLGKLVEKGYDIHMKNYNLSIKDDNNNFIAKVMMSKNRMFLINIQNDVAKCPKACYKDASCLWHLRFRHLNFGGLELLSKKEMVKGLPRINHSDQLCEWCLVVKQFRKSFPKESETRAKKPLELIHTDVCGPIKPNSLVQEKQWRDAMDEEIKAIEKNATWEITSLPKGHKAIEEVYIQQPSGYEFKGHEDKVLKLKKDLYRLKQENFAKKILKKFKMENCKTISTPKEYGIKMSKHEEGESVDPTFFKRFVGSLHYLTYTRPNILHTVRLVSRYMKSPTTTHFKAAKRILHYLKGTIDFGFFYLVSNDYKLVGYSDSDWGGDIDNRMSTTGFVIFMGDTAFTWM
ncbi:BTB/POZ and MATH domain-containing protein 4-like [Hibiscus syriacus]|uniref:BTB/POZ and MATH domain-containing protein 4-like n=1 Tax=Hibiscus syriacus TaxID=106335 RepID=A0A6A3A4K1_HIBSY|nr:BTB/POZ and MATH domain-containing protein 4-like [Hibiscus syriacus]